jgi:hypothetical protein
MKKYYLLLVLFCVSLFSFSQTEYGSHTLFKNQKKNVVNTYISFDGSYAENKTGQIGLTLGATTNHSFTVGLTGSFIINPSVDSLYSNPPPGHSIRTYCGYGGILLEPTIFPKFFIHLTIPVVLGVGGISYVLHDDYWNEGKDADTYVLCVGSAGLRLELNVIHNVRISCGPSYRYFWVPNIENNLSGFALDLSIKLGEY